MRLDDDVTNVFLILTNRERSSFNKWLNKKRELQRQQRLDEALLNSLRQAMERLNETFHRQCLEIEVEKTKAAVDNDCGESCGQIVGKNIGVADFPSSNEIPPKWKPCAEVEEIQKFDENSQESSEEDDSVNQNDINPDTSRMLDKMLKKDSSQPICVNAPEDPVTEIQRSIRNTDGSKSKVITELTLPKVVEWSTIMRERHEDQDSGRSLNRNHGCSDALQVFDKRLVKYSLPFSGNSVRINEVFEDDESSVIWYDLVDPLSPGVNLYGDPEPPTAAWTSKATPTSLPFLPVCCNLPWDPGGEVARMMLDGKAKLYLTAPNTHIVYEGIILGIESSLNEKHRNVVRSIGTGKLIDDVGCEKYLRVQVDHIISVVLAFTDMGYEGLGTRLKEVTDWELPGIVPEVTQKIGKSWVAFTTSFRECGTRVLIWCDNKGEPTLDFGYFQLRDSLNIISGDDPYFFTRVLSHILGIVEVLKSWTKQVTRFKDGQMVVVWIAYDLRSENFENLHKVGVKCGHFNSLEDFVKFILCENHVIHDAAEFSFGNHGGVVRQVDGLGLLGTAVVN